MSELDKILNIDKDSTAKSFKKGEFIQKPDETTANAIFVKKGLIRSGEEGIRTYDVLTARKVF
tara:strand:- start:3 stop:191 length:189 start_codon:yes stop_codon:yes gene_type:complete